MSQAFNEILHTSGVCESVWSFADRTQTCPFTAPPGSWIDGGRGELPGACYCHLNQDGAGTICNVDRLSLSHTHAHTHTLAEIYDYRGVRFLKSRLEALGGLSSVSFCLFYQPLSFLLPSSVSLLSGGLIVALSNVMAGDLPQSNPKYKVEMFFPPSIVLHLSIFSIILAFAF